MVLVLVVAVAVEAVVLVVRVSLVLHQLKRISTTCKCQVSEVDRCRGTPSVSLWFGLEGCL
jgi:hypothetical protein